MKSVSITLLTFLILAASGMADDHNTIRTHEEESRQLQRDLREYEKTVEKHEQLLAQVREETEESELRQLREAQKAYQQAKFGYQAEQREMETRKRRHLDQLRILKLLEMLNLDEDQELEFIHVFQSMRRKHRKLQQERVETIETLAQSLEENSVTEEQIKRTLSRIEELDSEDQAGKRRFHEQAGAILAADQMGKLIVFHARFEHEILNQLREFRGRGMGRRSRGQTGGPAGEGEHLRRFDNY